MNRSTQTATHAAATRTCLAPGIATVAGRTNPLRAQITIHNAKGQPNLVGPSSNQLGLTG